MTKWTSGLGDYYLRHRAAVLARLEFQSSLAHQLQALANYGERGVWVVGKGVIETGAVVLHDDLAGRAHFSGFDYNAQRDGLGIHAVLDGVLCEGLQREWWYAELGVRNVEVDDELALELCLLNGKEASVIRSHNAEGREVVMLAVAYGNEEPVVPDSIFITNVDIQTAEPVVGEPLSKEVVSPTEDELRMLDYEIFDVVVYPEDKPFNNDGLFNVIVTVAAKENCYFAEGSRSAIWYTNDLVMTNSRIDGPKFFREMKNLTLENVEITDADETFWKVDGIKIKNVKLHGGTYPFMFSSNIFVDGLESDSKYVFQYCKNVEVHNAKILTKDSFWECENVTVYDSVLDGEYLAWHSKNVRLVNCHLAGEQLLCYTENLVLENCTIDKMCDRMFEYSTVEADIRGHIENIKNPTSGHIIADSIGSITIDENVRQPNNCVIEIRK